MDPIKKIMAAVVYTEHAEGLIAFAAQIAESMNAELVIVNIINVRDVEAVGSVAAMGYEVDSQHYVSGIKEERQQALSEILARISFPADKISAIFQLGHPVDEILKIAMHEKVDLMVMGIRGRSDLRHILVGSVAEKIFRRSPIPIVSYRDEKSVARLKKHIGIK
jgi:nucleotide-binding universal stress UspA family protein